MFENTARPLVVFGTRPEAIKMAPIVHELRGNISDFSPIICSTGQHREMLQQVVDYFDIEPDLSLDVMKPNQSLAELTSRVLKKLDDVVTQKNPNCIIVQGDTTTAMVGALLSFYHRLPCVHVEAGLRTGDLYSPWPEEFNRRVAGLVATLHCAPTQRAANCLLAEGVSEKAVKITGNTVIDALQWSVQKERSNDSHWWKKFGYLKGKEFVLITAHRRESFGDGFQNICKSIAQLATDFPNVQFVYPVHLNPNVQKPVNDLLGNLKNVLLLEPAPYPEFVWLMDQCKLILTDSGGIQEEAPTLRKPAIVMRDNTERLEAVEAGAVKLVGTTQEAIVGSVSQLLTDPQFYRSMQVESNPFGDGTAAQQIAEATLELLQEQTAVASV